MPIEGPDPHDITAALARTLAELRTLARASSPDPRILGALGHVAAAVALLEALPRSEPDASAA